MKPNRGFTLAELMTVVVIIGILAAIAIPNFIKMQRREMDRETGGNMHTVQLACEDYGVQNDGVYTMDPKKIEPLLPHPLKNSVTGKTMYVIYRHAGMTYFPGDLDKGQIIFSENIDDKGAVIPNSYAIRGVSAVDGALLDLKLTSGQ